MTSIWGFLQYTLAASVAAALLLAVKKLLEDKLPPGWQYHIWFLLLARLALPFGIDGSAGRYTLLPIPLWVETVKTCVEQHLTSAYDGALTLTRVNAPVGYLWPLRAPQSVTDWLFVLYLAGAAAALARYLTGYLRLRRQLRRALPLTGQQTAQLQQVCSRYGFPLPRAVRVPGLPTAFVCGVLRPVLALPDSELDDKVLLHELFHLKYRDSAQSMLWCFWRAVHWCNPLLQYCFDCIGNDGESLCDQRVLEKLQGEERRDYGRILLSMANDRYPRAAGTSSLSNGGKNIARRIQAIARFKHYPKGMALVAVCIAVMLFTPLVVGTRAAAPDVASGSYVDLNGPYDLRKAYRLASTRTNRCTTLAGALDVYARALWLNNREAYLTASDTEHQLALFEAARRGEAPLAETGAIALRTLSDHGNDLSEPGYAVWNLKEEPDGSYTGWLVYTWSGHVLLDAGATRAWIAEGWITDEMIESYHAHLLSTRMEDGELTEEEAELLERQQNELLITAAHFLPFRAAEEHGNWTVTALNEGRIVATSDYADYTNDQLAAEYLEPLVTYAGEGAQGSGTLRLYTVAVVQSSDHASGTITYSSDYTMNEINADASARFGRISQYGKAEYTEHTPTAPGSVQQAGMYTTPHMEAMEVPDAADHSDRMVGSVSGGSSSGEDWVNTDYSASYTADDGVGANRWTGRLRQSVSPFTGLEQDGPTPLPHSFTMQIYFNGELQDLLLLEQEG